MPETNPDVSTESRYGFLAPWTALLMGHELRVKTTCVSDDTTRFTFDAIYLNMQRNVMLDHASHHALQTMAEAVHLVATALALEPEAWTALLVDQCDCGFHFNPALHAPSELVPRFEFDCGHYPGDILVNKTGLRFFQVLLDTTARTAQFHTAMQQLRALSSDRELQSPMQVAPVAFKIDLSLWNEDEDILLGFTEFVCALEPFRDPRRAGAPDAWSFVETIELDWTGPGICSDLVQRTLSLVAHAPFVQITTATIDPKYVSCSERELRELVVTLTATYPRMNLRLGDVVPGALSRFDPDGSNTSSEPKLAMVMGVVASTRASVKYLNVGHLMTKAPLERDRRQTVWNHLFGTLLGPASACSITTLALNSTRVLNVASDARAIERAVTLFPNHTTPTRLTLGLTDANHASVRALVTAFGPHLEELRLYDRHHVIHCETIAAIVELCPKLVCLELENGTINSMDLFYGPRARCRLSRLVLNNVVLQNTASLAVFLTQLADPQSRVGSTLGEFVLARCRHSAIAGRNVAMALPHIPLVHNVLRSNGRVHTLQLDVDETVTPAAVGTCMAQHRRAAAVRRAPLALTSKLALLSALEAEQQTPWMHMSTDVLRNVFEFAADCKPRWVHVKPAW